MGAVHAKSVGGEDIADSTDASSSSDRVDLQGLKAQVQRVHISGLGRTKEDIVISSVKDVFDAQDFQTVIVRIHEARTKLEGLGCFKGVGVVIDTYDGEDALQEGIQVTFEVEEVNLLGARVNTSVGYNEGSISGGAALKNVLGRGEEFSANYTKGTKKTTNFATNFVKPLHNDVNAKLTGSLYQSYLEAGWSGFRELDRGLLFGVAFNGLPNVTQQLLLDCSWRQLSCLSKSTAFAVREHTGHTLKTALRHELSVDTRDCVIFPTEGNLVKVKSEVAGGVGNIGFVKNEFNAQSNVSLPLGFVAQATIHAGHLSPIADKVVSICDRFTVGGPMTVRGFQMGGIGPHSDGCALGGDVYWGCGAHLYSPLPLLPRGTFTDRFRLHMWANMANLHAGGDAVSLSTLTSSPRLSCGAGAALNVAGLARVELNYCLPLSVRRGDRPQPGIQFGIAAEAF